MKTILQKWCGKPWLIATYGMGIWMMVWALLGWHDWEMPKKLLFCLLAALLALHVFEENTFPDGFHYMMNLVMHSDHP